MEFDVEKFKNEYLSYLNESLTGNLMEDHYELSLPFYDRFNDALQVYVEESKDLKNEYIISDDAYIINSLISGGFKLSDKRVQAIQSICNKLGVQLIGKTLIIKSNKRDLVAKVHSLGQAMLRIDDMYLTSKSRATSYFLEDVIAYLENNEVYCASNVSFVGKSGLTHDFDFLFQKNKVHSERLCKTMNNATKNNMINMIFAWEDILSERKNSELIVLINDENKVDVEIINGLSNYGINSIEWSNIDNEIDCLR